MAQKPMTLKTLRTQRQRFVDGAWVGSDIHGLPGLFFRVKGWRNPEWSTLVSKLSADVPKEERVDGQPSPEAWDRILDEAIVETVLTDWRGLKDDDDSPEIPFDRDTARQLLTEPGLAFLRSAIITSAQNVAEAGRETIEAELKN